MKYLFVLFVILISVISSYADNDYTGHWDDYYNLKIFSRQYNPKNSPDILYFNQDIENKNFVIIDTNKIIYRINMYDGSLVSKKQIPLELNMPNTKHICLTKGDSIILFFRSISCALDTHNYDNLMGAYTLYNFNTNAVYSDTIDFEYQLGFGWSISIYSTIFFDFENVNKLLINVKYNSNYYYHQMTEGTLTILYDYKEHTYKKTSSSAEDCYVSSKKNVILYSNSSSYYKDGGSNSIEETNRSFQIDLFDSLLNTIKRYSGNEKHYIDWSLHIDKITQSGYYYLKNCGGFTGNGEYMVNFDDDSLYLLGVIDTTKQIHIPYESIYLVFGYPITANNELIVIRGTEIGTAFEKYDYVTGKTTPLGFKSSSLEYSEFYKKYMIDSNTLIVSNEDICRYNINEYAQNTGADFKLNYYDCYIGDTVKYFSCIFGAYDSLKWDFGDGKYSSELNPFHLYSDSGKYTVSLYVFRQNKTDTIIKSNCINLRIITVPNLSIEVNDTLKPYTMTIKLNPGDYNYCFVIPDGQFQKIVKQNESCVYYLTHSGIFNIKIKFFDIFNRVYYADTAIVAQLPLSENLEWEKYYNLKLKPNFFCFESNNGYLINALNTFNDSVNINSIIRINNSGIIEQSIKFNSEPVNMINTYKFSDNLFLNYYDFQNQELNKSFISDSNFNIIGKITLNPDFKIFKIDNKRFYAFMNKGNEFGMYLFNIDSPEQSEFTKLLNFKANAVCHFANDIITVFAEDSLNRNQTLYYVFDLSGNIISQSELNIPYSKIINLKIGKYLFYSNDFIKYFDTSDKSITNVSIENFLCQNSKKINSEIIAHSGLNTIDYYSQIFLKDNKFKTLDSITIENCHAFIKDKYIIPTDTSLFLIGYDAETANLYVAKTKPFKFNIEIQVPIDTINPINNSEKLLYPNPVNKLITINNLNSKPLKLIITDIEGKSFDFTDKFSYNVEKCLQLNIEILGTGAYILKIVYEDTGSETYKFIKE